MAPTAGRTVLIAIETPARLRSSPVHTLFLQLSCLELLGAPRLGLECHHVHCVFFLIFFSVWNFFLVSPALTTMSVFTMRPSLAAVLCDLSPQPSTALSECPGPSPQLHISALSLSSSPDPRIGTLPRHPLP